MPPRGFPRRTRDLIATVTGKHAEHSQRLTIRAEFRACISERHLLQLVQDFLTAPTMIIDRCSMNGERVLFESFKAVAP